MKRVLLFILAFSVFSCNKKQEESTTIPVKTQVPAVGADEDLHGCKSSAGYTWSELDRECIRIFEKGTRLDAYKDSLHTIMPAFVIFKDNKAEVFIQTEKSPVVMERKSEGMPFVNNDWQLIPWKGYVLKKGDEIRFTSP